MANRSKQKGTAAETAVVNRLRIWFPGCERRTLSGAHDKGDIAGVPGAALEVKACGTYQFPAWLAEAKVEATNAGEQFYAAIIKPRGVGDTRVGEWWVLTHLDNYAELLSTAHPSADRLLGRAGREPCPHDAEGSALHPSLCPLEQS